MHTYSPINESPHATTLVKTNGTNIEYKIALYHRTIHSVSRLFEE